MSDFDALVPEVNAVLLDVAYGNALELVEKAITTWRAMGQDGTPDSILEIAGQTRDYDAGFFHGGCVGLEALKMEIESERSTIFLS